MFSGYTSGDYQSVIFFVDGHVDREMLFAEFEAILDNFVPIPGYADKNVQAVCVGINGQLKIISAVFFCCALTAQAMPITNGTFRCKN